MQIDKKDKTALQEKIKAQRQAMWWGKPSTSQDSTETASEETNPDEPSVQPESDSEGQAPAAGAAQNMDHTEKTAQPPASTAPFTPAVETPTSAENTAEQEAGAREGEQVFWEGQADKQPVLTWKLVLGVIIFAIILIGAGVWLGYEFAG